MRDLIKECAPWLNWKVAAIFAAGVVCIGFIGGADLGMLAVAGAAPLLALAACLVPCLVPLVLLRRSKEPVHSAAPATSRCSCGSDGCTASCQPQKSLVMVDHSAIVAEEQGR